MWIIYTVYQSLLHLFFPRSCFSCGKEGVALCYTCINSTKRVLDTQPPYTMSIFNYKDQLIKRTLHAIKYYHRKDLLPPLANVLVDKIVAERYEGVLVPIPMPTIRMSMRGYNQASLLATILSKGTRLMLREDILVRSKSPARQVTMNSKSSRLLNQKHTFKVTNNVVGLDIILVDDVTTTGATLNEARKILLKHKAKSVTCVTLAH